MAEAAVIDVPVGQRTCVRCRFCVGGDHLGPTPDRQPYSGHDMAYCTRAGAPTSCPAERHIGECGTDAQFFEAR